MSFEDFKQKLIDQGIEEDIADIVAIEFYETK